MAAPLIQTKLNIPAIRRKLLIRQHLIDRLNDGMDCRLTLISAPAGFGKTTLLTAWVRQAEIPTAWISLDEGDNDIGRFLAYLDAALGKIDPDHQDEYLAVSFLTDLTLTDRLAMVINHIDLIQERFLLVLDDYHLIYLQEIHDAITFLLDNLPDQVHLVIATRADPPFPLARMRARGQLNEIRQIDLSFSTHEVEQFLEQVLDLHLSSIELTTLTGKTEGWIAGIQLAGISMQGRVDVSSYLKEFSGSDRFVLDYLVEEVFELLSNDIQQFLLKTSILDQMNGPLCDALKFENSQATLEFLEQANIFLVPLDNRREWYRYHLLFRDLLRQRLGREEPELIMSLHKRASAWYEENGIVEQAIEHSLEAGEFQKSADLIEQHGETLLSRGEFHTLKNWCERVPIDIRYRRTRLLAYYAGTIMLLGFRFEELLSRIEEFQAHTEANATIGEFKAFQAILATMEGDFEKSLNLSHQALEALPEQEKFFRGLIFRNLGSLHYMKGDVVSAIQVFERDFQFSQKYGNTLAAMVDLRRLGDLNMVKGELRHAKAIYEEALDLAGKDVKRLSPIIGRVLIGIGRLHFEWNQLEESRQKVEEGLERAEKGAPVWSLGGYLTHARLMQALGQPEMARRSIKKAQQLAEAYDATEIDDLLVMANRARLWLAHGDLEAAAQWAYERVNIRDQFHEDAIAEYCRGLERSYYLELESLVMVRIFLALGKAEQALELSDLISKHIEKSGRIGSLIEILALKALALQAQGRKELSITAIKRSLELAESENYMRTFLDEGQPMMRLLYSAASQGIAQEYCSRILEAFKVEIEKELPPKELKTIDSSPRLAMVEPLSERELEVLRLLADGLTNNEIAQELVVTISTVKWHTSNIYGKLGVKNRTQAVANARFLGLFSSEG